MNPQFVKFSGATFERNGAHFRITGMKGDVLYAEGDDDAILSIDPSELRLLEASGKLAWAQGEKPLIHNSTSETVQLHLSETKQLVLATVACRKNSLSWKETIEHLETDFPTFRHVGIRRLQQLIKSYEADGIAGLERKWHRSGNRDQRYSDLFLEICLKKIDEIYLKHANYTLADVHKVAIWDYLEECKTLGIPPGNCGRKAFQAILDRFVPYALAQKKRFGAQRAKNLIQPALSLIQIEAPFERVELDCTQLDVFVVDDETHEVLGRPHICIAIDCCTGLIVGMQIQLGAPDNALVAKTMVEMLEPKTKEFFDKFEIENRLGCFGTPLQIVMDQGSENSGRMTDAIMHATGAELHKCIPGHPERKPFVERFMLTLSKAVRALPGGIVSSTGKKQGGIDAAMKQANMTLDQLEAKLQAFRYDVYANRTRASSVACGFHGMSATEIWKRKERTLFGGRRCLFISRSSNCLPHPLRQSATPAAV